MMAGTQRKMISVPCETETCVGKFHLDDALSIKKKPKRIKRLEAISKKPHQNNAAAKL